MITQDDGHATTTKSTFRIAVAVSTTIHAPPDAIWSVLTNARDFPRWNTTVQSIQGMIAPGETIHLVATIAPTRTFKLRVTTWEPPTRMVWQEGTAVFQGVRRFTLTPTQAGATAVTMVETFSGLLLPLIARSLPDQGPSFERFLADLKAEVEHTR